MGIREDAPTDEEFFTAQDVLEWLQSYYEEYEPTAVNSIRLLENAALEIPTSASELDFGE